MAENIEEISAIERLKNSVNGNPRFSISFASIGAGESFHYGGSAITSSDHSFCYKIGNPGLRVGSVVRVEFTRAGRICGLYPLKSARFWDDKKVA
jgi:hypothetical protein